MSVIMLTDQERRRFVAYLEQQVLSNEGFIQQAKKINVPEAMIENMRIKSAAASLVARELKSIESFTASAEEPT